MLANRLVRACEGLFALRANPRHPESRAKLIPAGQTVADSRPVNFFAGVKNSGELVQAGRRQSPTSHRGKRFQKKTNSCSVGRAKHFIAISSGFRDLACQEPA